MPFLSENIASATLSRKSATALAPNHIHIRPLSRPSLKYGIDVPMRTTFMPATYRNDSEAINRTAVRVDDVWVVGFPKSGTIVVQDLVWMLLHGCDEELAKNTPFRERTPLLERTSMTHPRLNKTFRPSWELVDRMASPRVIRTHLPLLLLPTTLWRTRPPIIYVNRDPSEIAALYYQEYVLMNGYKGSAADFVELLTNDCVAYAPYLGHVRDFAELQGIAPNILNVKFHDTEDGIRNIINELAAFLDIPVTDEQCDALVAWTKRGESAIYFREDVHQMDTLLKRPPTMDFEPPQLPAFEWTPQTDRH